MTEPLSFELSRPAVDPPRLPEAGVAGPAPADVLPREALRSQPPGLPRLSEPEIMRHYSRLASMNYSISENFYPLGSCTMKYNPVLNEQAAALPGWELAFPEREFLNEFPIRAPKASTVVRRLARKGILGGLDVSRWFRELKGVITLTCTEVNDPAAIDELLEVLAA